MKPTFLFSDEPETMRLMMVEEVTSGGVAVPESEARAGCNCDRWGHPCAGCFEHNKPEEADTPISSAIKTAR